MQKWANDVKNVEDEGINLAIIAAYNHYAGFGNIFTNMLGLPEAKWEEKEEEEEQQQQQRQKHPSNGLKQRTLSDFLS